MYKYKKYRIITVVLYNLIQPVHPNVFKQSEILRTDNNIEMSETQHKYQNKLIFLFLVY